jgi:hypothetical protein
MGVRARALAIAWLVTVAPAAAEDGGPLANIFLFSGADFASTALCTWGGFVLAPFGRLDEDGLRLKVAEHAGGYRYTFAGGDNLGRYASADMLVGWRRAFDQVIVVAYAGAYGERQWLFAPDPGNPVGLHFGVKAALEVFARLPEHFVVNAFASATSVHNAYQVRAKLLYEFMPALAFGVDGGILGNADYRQIRAGLAGVLNFEPWSVTIAGGYAMSANHHSSPYVTLSFYWPL